MPILFFLFWVILNGKFTLEIALFGVAISFAVYLFCVKFLGYRFKNELGLYKRAIRLLGFVFLLLWEIGKANIDVLRVIYRRKGKTEPSVITFSTDLKTDAARVALANAITLTPGTITVFQEKESYTVHCLDKSFADGIEDSSFVRYLRKTERLKGSPVEGKEGEGQ